MAEDFSIRLRPDEFSQSSLGIDAREKKESFASAILPNHAHLLLRTGTVHVSAFMNRLLTGYAGWFNKKHRRHGQLFQNRCKSILCQEDPCLKERVRCIHLNPLRAGLAEVMEGPDKYPWGGHGVLMNAF